MLKVLSLMKRKEGMSYAEFRNWALNEHPPLAHEASRPARLPHERAASRRTRTRPMTRSARCGSTATRRALAGDGTDAGKAAGGDAAAHCASRFHFIAEEKTFI